MKSLNEFINEKLKVSKMQFKQINSLTDLYRELILAYKKNNYNLDLSYFDFSEYTDDITELENSFKRFFETDGINNTVEYLNVSNWIFHKNINKIDELFYNLYKVKEIKGLETWDISNIKSCTSLFSYCHLLQNIDGISNWNTKSLISISNIFYKCYELFKIDLSNWDVSNVRFCSSLFCYCNKLKSVDGLENWNTENFVSISMMFNKCNELKSIGDISKWNISKVTKSDFMFYECHELKSIGDISKWNISKILDMSYMFFECISLSIDLSSWTTKKNDKCDMYNAFKNTNNNIFIAPKI